MSVPVFKISSFLTLRLNSENGLRQAELDLSDEPGFGNQSNLLPIQDLAKEFESHKELYSNETKEDQVLLSDSALVSLSKSKSDQISNPSTPEALDLKDETSKNSDLSKSTTVKSESEAVNDQFNITIEVHQNIEIGPETFEDYPDKSIDALNEEDFSVTAHNSVDSITDIALTTTSKVFEINSAYK